MKPFSHRWLRPVLLPTVVILLSACGASGSSDLSGGSDGSGAASNTAVSASPHPDRIVEGGTPGAAGSTAAATTPVLAGKSINSKREPVIRPGVESPLDSAPDRISKRIGTRLFATGFEEGVLLTQEPQAHSPFQYLIGSDTPGYQFPIDLGSAAAERHSWINADVGQDVPMPVSEYARSSIKTVAGRNGQTRALSLHSKAQSPRTSAQQIAVQDSILATEPVVFQRMWIKFDADTLERARAVGCERFYQMFWEVKAGPDFWLRLKLHHDDAKGLFWVAKGNGMKAEESYWEASMNEVPVVLAAASSSAGWHKVEIWLDRRGGRFKVAIDGRTLVDRGGVLMGADGEGIDDYRMMMVSSTVAPLAEVLFDDLEFWDAPPEDAWVR